MLQQKSHVQQKLRMQFKENDLQFGVRELHDKKDLRLGFRRLPQNRDDHDAL